MEQGKTDEVACKLTSAREEWEILETLLHSLGADDACPGVVRERNGDQANKRNKQFISQSLS